jgi:hypothetical protein
VASAWIRWIAALNPSGVPLGPATLERFTSSMVLPTPSAGIAWGEAGLIVERGGVCRMGSDRDGGDHTLDEGDGHPDARGKAAVLAGCVAGASASIRT